MSRLIPFILIVLTVGCGTGSPRFTAGETKSSDSGTSKERTVRFAREIEKARQEEITEDDVKVNVQEVKTRLLERESPVEYETEAGSRIVLPTRQQTIMLSELLKHIGTPYKLGGMSREGMDCSAYTYLVFRNALNFSLPRSTVEQYRMGRPIQKSEVRFGDLVFFNTTGSNPSHVGIYIGENLFAHANVSYGVTISSLESSYYRNRITGVRRILE